ncbi:methylmalonyl Co-A mutase-associated GTPase MeaB [Fulvivirga lutimaris]|uniref:methylmalonyl Co-A mutase-associated GTPase MeaB n=1 Tax=Fulvivirga lutimaris TaxID=1819566 RepID=UPI0012BD5700|nr:methylmalonyl Co-A mutase-associated GTPase MeaB [Fulvivirga lutimaris]MTI40291.1 methylmalonyl Co-A mutase-associated GTPase MeaB [Fulvivirga lutimaris]
MAIAKRKRLTTQEYISGINDGNRVILSRAITLVESSLTADRDLSETIINELLSSTGKSLRVGITGVPGVGKSTFIEALGIQLCDQGHKVAVLAVDPSSQKSGGSILGDKTRMEQLAHHPNAFIRPSPTGKSLGGVANKTRETMLLCEAAGFDIILIETVGVGQSEVAVKGMVDFFLLLMLAGAGDELQGIKKGIMEMADGIVITKSDEENVKASKRAKSEYQNAIHLFPPNDTGWYPKVLTCSSKDNVGIDEVWNLILDFKSHMEDNNALEIQRQQQNIDWLHETLNQGLLSAFYEKNSNQAALKSIEEKVKLKKITPQAAARQLLSDKSKSE